MSLTLPTGVATPLPLPSFSLSWEDKGEVNTRQGPRHLFVSPMPDGWWDYWKLHKDALKKQGFSCGKSDSGSWQVTCWLIPANSAPKANYSEMLLELSRSEKPGMEWSKIPFPEGVTPYPYQLAGIEYACARPRVIIGDDMGLGKTMQAIGVCNVTKARKILIVCPASLRLNWRDEVEKFGMGLPIPHPVLSKADIPEIANHDAVVISYDLMAMAPAQKMLRDREWDVVIADEAHYLKNKTTKRATGLLGLPPRARSKTKAPREAIAAKRHLFLSGTPVSNRPEDFWNLLRFCAPEHFGVWSKFATRFCDARRVPFGSGWDTSGASNLQELQTMARGTCMVRRLKKNVLTQLPAKTRKIVSLPTPVETIRELDALTMDYTTSEKTVAIAKQKLAEAKLAGDADSMARAVDSLRSAENALFTETSKVRKHIGMSKVDVSVDHIRNALESSGGKVIIGAHHKQVISRLREELEEFKPVVVTGDTPPQDRHDAVQRFQNDPSTKVFIGNILAAGTGLTLTAAPHVIIVEPDWVPSNNAQFEDRAHRIGQKSPVLIEYLAMEQTIDIQILRANARKMDVIEQAIDNDGNAPLNSSEVNYGPKGPAEPSRSVAQREQDDSDQRKRKMAAMKLGQSLSPGELVLALTCVRQVAKMDGDHATARNDVGFNKMDSEYGGRLARKRLESLTDFEKGRICALAWKYRRQCDPAWVAKLRNPNKPKP